MVNGGIGGIGGAGHGPFIQRDARIPDIGDGDALREMTPGRIYDTHCPSRGGQNQSFVDFCHDGAHPGDTVENLQQTAYTLFREQAPQHMVTGIDDQMLMFLGVAGTAGDAAGDASLEDIHQELFDIEARGLIDSEERELIELEIEQFVTNYQEAFPDMGDEVYMLARDNARKLAFQTARDKEVFSGSDHGTKHIIEGNIRLADQIINGLINKGVNVTPLDKVLIHQAIIDHDLGYVTHEARTSFLASKDHPLVSAAYIDTHREYYDTYFPGCREKLFDSVLNHSYPKWDLAPDPANNRFNPNLLRSIVSTVDALGVTSNVKCPAFFREPDVVVELQRLQFAREAGLATETYIEQTKENLGNLLALKTELSPTRRRMILEAIENNVTSRTPEFLLPQYAGKVRSIGIEETEHGDLVPVVEMEVSREHMVLCDIFGDKMAFGPFEKALRDFGADNAIRGQLKNLMNLGMTGDVGIDVDTDGAVFRFHPRSTPPDPALRGVFEDMREFSIRGEFAQLRETINGLDDARADFGERLETAAAIFFAQVDEKAVLTPEDRSNLQTFIARLATAPDRQEAQAIVREGYTTTREREFIAHVPLMDTPPQFIGTFIQG